jgi:hypothetical protein
MAVRNRNKKFAAALLLLLLGGFIYTTTGARAAKPAGKVAPQVLGQTGTQVLGQTETHDVPRDDPKVVAASREAERFDGDVQTPIQVTCAPGATRGTGDVKMQVIAGPSGLHAGDTLSPPVTVTWDGGSTVITKYKTFFTVHNASLPCPGVAPAAKVALAVPSVNLPFIFHFTTGNHTEIAQLLLNITISINLGL